MSTHIEVDVFVLAGGVSSRMGAEKGLLNLAGVPVVVRTVRLVEPLVRQVTVIGSVDTYSGLGLHIIPDRDFRVPSESGRSKGALLGIATALSTTDAPQSLILACDLPYLTPEWIEWLLARAAHSNAQVIVPQTCHGLEPLAAVYRRECLSTIEQALARGVRRVTDALGSLALEVVSQHEWAPVDPSGLVLKNMNTPADYEEAREWWDSRTNQ